MNEYTELKPLRNNEVTDDRGTESILEEQEAPKPIPTPPNEEPYTLTGYGDISLSDINYVPGPPSEISPSQATKKESWRRVPRNDSESMVRFPRLLLDFDHSTCNLDSRGAFRAEFDRLRFQKVGPRNWRRLTS